MCQKTFVKNFEWLGYNMTPIIKRSLISTNRHKNKIKSRKPGSLTFFSKNIKNIK